MTINELTQKVIGCAIEVHRNLGPGLLESVYEQCLARELDLSGISFKRQQPVPVNYKGVILNCGYRIDLMIENRLIFELKTVDQINDIHQAQILSYMKLTGVSLGLLINFNVDVLVNGLKRFVL